MTMPGFYDIYVMLLFLSAAIALALTFYCWQNWQTPGAKTFSWWMLTTFIWVASIGLGITSSTEALAAIWQIRIKIGAVSFISASITLFALDYTGRRAWLRPRYVVPLLVIPICIQAVMWLQFPLFARDVQFQHIDSYIFTDFTGGPWWYIHLIYSYGMGLLGLILLLSRIVSGFSMYRWRAVVLFIGTLLPLVGSALTAFDLVAGLQIDVAAVCTIILGPLWAWMIFRHQLLNIMPVARDKVFESVDDAILVLDAHHTVIDANPAARKLIRLDHIVGRPVRDVFAPYADWVEQHEDVTEAQAEIDVPVGKANRVYDLRISPLYHEKEAVVGRLVVLRDVTERARLIHELDAYAHTVAHDLKTPLTGILGFVEMIEFFEKERLSGTALDYVGQIRQSGRKMESIIDDLLLMASARGMNIVEIDPLDMGAIVTDAQERLRLMIREHQVKIVQPERWLDALGYAPWVEAVWANYLSNAIKYGGAPPCIELGAVAQAEGMVRYWVRDNGRGLTAEEQARLFQQFARLDQSRANGHGLGLSIVRRIVEKQGGQVGFENAVGGGSIFYFTLPAAPSTPYGRGEI